MFVFSACSETESSSGDTQSHSTSSEEQSSEEKVYGVGDTVTGKDVDITLIGVTHPEGSEYTKPEEGKVYTLLEFEITNKSNEDVAVSSMLSFDCYVDAYQTSISLSALMNKGDAEQLDGTVAAGKKMKGVVGYEIDEGWKTISISFQPDAFGSDKATFTVNK